MIRTIKTSLENTFRNYNTDEEKLEHIIRFNNLIILNLENLQ